MLSNFQPTKVLTFNVTAPVQASTIDVTDAAAAVVGLSQVYMVQHLGGRRFQVILYNSVAMEQLHAHGNLSICGQSVAIEPLMPRVTRVACFHLPGYVPDEYIVRALTPYGKIVKLEKPTITDRPTVCNGIRVAHLEMRQDKPVPNFISILEHRVTCDYPGVNRVCSRCKQPGHFRGTCDVPYCPRCSNFGHAADTCTARCRRCAGSHATTDCVRKKSFAETLDARPQRRDQRDQATPFTEMREARTKQPDQRAQTTPSDKTPEAQPKQPDQGAQTTSVSWTNTENFPPLGNAPKTLVLPPEQTPAPSLEEIPAPLEMPLASTHKTSSGDEINLDTKTPTWTPASPTPSDASIAPLVIDEDSLETEEVQNKRSPPNSDMDSQDPQQNKDPRPDSSSPTVPGTTNTTTRRQRALRARTPKTKKPSRPVSPGSDWVTSVTLAHV